ncbi:MAG: response regulator transcription factor [Bacteroidetes bacterium]|nr:response regulator transcription factor [Bacteroidota bacterium]MBX7128268.1 LytTR family DNA-binding domain-containing protein [Flavobacteriales bacterium]MCC6655321.1 response regulator transcription factor [Flavobacteriales bacterium]HMU12894.1 LytTR family DNA-binding domain-containing protein [Flavobacteriales bacterium]HMW98132.1 LytTR family DNA-binding domain-containing protein [Flavobacteriales bacterium]
MPLRPIFQVRGERVQRVLYLADHTHGAEPVQRPMGAIKAVIVDDSADNRDYLRTLLASAHPHVRTAGEAANIQEALLAIARHSPDLVFLDVEMPGGSGFDLLRKLEQWPFEVIFCTAYERYAVQAIRFSALDYLLKPVQPDELAEALARFEQRRAIEHRSAVQRQFLSNLGAPDEQAMKLTLTTGDRTWFVSPAELTHCTADDNYTELHTLDGRRFVSARTLKDYEDMLAPLGFLRVHRSSLVNRSAITHLDDGHVVLKNSARVEISRRKKEEVLKALAG